VPDAPEATPAPPDDTAIRRFFLAVYQALDLPAPARLWDRRAYLTLLERRARLVRASIGRLIGDPHSDTLDYASEGDHLLHQLADLPARTYRHHPKEQ
jgi:hypothetical protein